MAKNRKPTKIVESDTSDDSARETGSDSGSEPKLTQTQSSKKPASSIPAKKPASKPQQPSSANEARKIKPAATDPVTPTRSAAKKRSAEVKATDGKASKKKPTDTPKSKSQRVWSEDDELVILQGIVDYKDEKKADPSADMDAFIDFIKKSLSRKDFEKSQLQNKIKKLKRKYSDNKIREGKGGNEMTFSKPHEQSLFELSKSAWGNKNDVKESNSKAAVNKRRSVVAEKADAAKEDKAVDAETETAKRVEERVLTIGADKFGNGKGVAVEWKKLRLEEMQANLKLLEVKTAQARLLVVNCLGNGIV